MTDLKPYNTFGISALASQFIEISSVGHLKELIQNKSIEKGTCLILGGGSNILFTGDYQGIVLKNNIKGIHLLKENEDHVWIKVAGGEVWHDFVMYAIKNNWGGIENLSLIPGTVGAAPMQNIGAYGVEIKETFESLEAVDMVTGELITFNNSECKFGYRDSIFKNEVKGKYFITSVLFRLNKNPVMNTSYGDIQNLLHEWKITDPSINDVSKAVISIRQSKLPDPAVIGNAGSFFKNPVIDISHLESLKVTNPAIKFFTVPGNKVKIPAGWLIEQAGWKGKRMGNVGIHEKQALVLVNYGNGTGQELIDLAYSVIDSIDANFGIKLSPEVNIV